MSIIGFVFFLTLSSPNQTASLMKLYLQELPNPILPIRYIPLPIQDTVEYSIQVFQSLPYVTQKFLCDLLPLFIGILENSSRTNHSSQTIAMCLAPCFIGRYSTRKDSMAVAIRFTRNLIELWPEIDDRLAEYSESDTSCSDSEPAVKPTHRKTSRKKSFEDRNHPSAFRATSRHNIRTVNSHQDVSNTTDAFPGVSAFKTAVRSFSSTAPRSANLKTESDVSNNIDVFADIHVVRPSRSISSVSSTQSSTMSNTKSHSSADNSNVNNIVSLQTQSEEYLAALCGGMTTPPPSVSSSAHTHGQSHPPPPPPKLRKSASTILRPTTKTPPTRPKLNTRSSFSGDSSQKHSESATTVTMANSRNAAAKTVTTTKRGRMVAELAKLYEEKNSQAVLAEMDKSKSNIQIS